MRYTLSLGIFLFSLNLCAEATQSFPITIPYPSVAERYYSTLRALEKPLLMKLKNKASAVCGGEDQVQGIDQVELKFAFSTLQLDSDNFTGSYPSTSLTATVHCN